MDIAQELKTVDWKYLLTSFDGRIPRLHFWIGAIAVGVTSAVVSGVLGAVFGALSGYLGLLVSVAVSLVALYPQYALLVKRGHDRGRPEIIAQVFLGVVALMLILSLVPFLGLLVMPLSLVVLIGAIALLIDYGCMPGTPGPNQYGPDPLAGQR